MQCGLVILSVLAATALPLRAQLFDPPRYDIGSPVLSNLWVDCTNGNDAASGATSNQALRTVSEAWNRIPSGADLSGRGFRIRLLPGDYPDAGIPDWWAGRHGTFSCPILIQAENGAHTARFHGFPDVNDCRYLYFVHLDIVTDPASAGGGNTLHLASCDHVLLRGCRLDGFDGSTRKPQETLKANQVRHLYVEDCDISGAFWYALDYVAVQYGHIVNCRIHSADEWGVLLKGGSAQLRVEGNEVYNVGTGGIVAGNGTGFEFMASPWLHYEACDIKIVNNVVHDAEGAGLGVNGGCNILLAYNTCYRTGSRDHVLEVVQGMRSCDGDVAACASNRAAGGWGVARAVDHDQYIPCRNVYVFNNLFYNPAPFRSQWQHFAIAGPATPPADSGVPAPSAADTNLRIRGNLIWNGPAGHPLGVESGDAGGQPGNPTCNAAQLRAENAINAFEPQLVNPAGGDYRPLPGGNVHGAQTYAIPDFAGDDRPRPPLAPAGNPTNGVPREFNGHLRRAPGPPGAWTGGASLRMLGCVPTNGQARLSFLGEAGYRYGVEVSSNLVDWSSVGAVYPAEETNALDDAAPAAPLSVYRATLLP